MDNGSNATLNVYPNLEAIAEFKVLTSNYGAQYGRNGSGTVESKPRAAPMRSTAALSTMVATNSLTPGPGRRGKILLRRRLLIEA